jgi:hypothetical protein
MKGVALHLPSAGDLCEHHARLQGSSGEETVVTGSQTKRRSARPRTPVVAKTELLELTAHTSGRPSAVRPALAVTAAEEVETIRRILLEAATNTTRESWATCSCPECGKSFRQEISVPDHGARIKAVETARVSVASVRRRSPNRGCQHLSPRSKPSAGLT